MKVTTKVQQDTRIIDIAELRADAGFPAYAAVRCRPGDNPFVLASRVMRWSDRVYLVQLDDCKDFWLRQKKKQRCKLGQLFEPLLEYHYGEDYLAVFADHPWQCLLYLQYQLAHRARGLYFLQSPLDRNIYQTLEWETWFAPQQQLARHLRELKTRGFREQSLLARQSQMRRFIERIGIANPFELQGADANSIQRRFGKWLALVWRWTFTRGRELQGFPWLALQPSQTASCRRDLEYPVNRWDAVELLLREDFQRLCERLNANQNEHINRMLWRITLFNYDKIEVELSFRHPYSMQRDRPGFATALYQARYVYDDLMRKLQARDRDLDLPEHMPLLSWTLEVQERVVLAPALWDLFARQGDDVDYQRVFELQNKLPQAFECYQLNTSFFPERSFRRSAPGVPAKPGVDDYQWASSAANKPLFYYPEPRPIDTPSQTERVFLERNSNQWWLGEDALQSIRDYYLLKDRRGRASWVYRTAAGNWFKQGEFF